MLVFLVWWKDVDFIIQQRSCDHFNLLLLLSCNFNNFNNFVTLASTSFRTPEDDADALKHVGVLTIHKILSMYKYICCVSVGLDNKLQPVNLFLS
jgi:hypothetical protein